MKKIILALVLVASSAFAKSEDIIKRDCQRDFSVELNTFSDEHSIGDMVYIKELFDKESKSILSQEKFVDLKAYQDVALDKTVTSEERSLAKNKISKMLKPVIEAVTEELKRYEGMYVPPYTPRRIVRPGDMYRSYSIEYSLKLLPWEFSDEGIVLNLNKEFFTKSYIHGSGDVPTMVSHSVVALKFSPFPSADLRKLYKQITFCRYLGTFSHKICAPQKIDDYITSKMSSVCQMKLK